MSGGLVALLDDVAALARIAAASVDDVAAGAAKAGAKAAGVEAVVFDHGGHGYHGRIAALADAAREGGLKF